MINVIQNTIGALARRLGIVKTNLQIWLGFTKADVLGAELVVNGDFATDSDWLKDTGWTISGDALNFDGSSSNNSRQLLSGYSTSKIYQVTYTITVTSGGAYVNLGYNSLTTRTISGTYTEEGAFLDGGAFNGYIRVFSTGASEFSISNISVKEVAQFAPDKSTNTNNAKLFTGKALSFDGVNDSIDFDALSYTGEFTMSAWFKVGSGLEHLLGLDNSSSNQVYFNSGNQVIIKVDGLFKTFNVSTFTDTYSRLVITRDSSDNLRVYINKVESTTGSDVRAGTFSFDAIGRSQSSYGLCALSDIQTYSAQWLQADIDFDYNNPNHLVTDNPNTTLTLSNLSAYYALSEGSGSIAYDSSGGGNNGTITGATYDDQQPTIPQLGMMDWSKGSNLIEYSEDFSEWVVGEIGLGAVTAKSITFGVSSASRVFSAAVLPSGTEITISLTLSSGDVGKYVRLGVYDGSWDYGTNILIPSSGLISRTLTLGGSASQYIGIIQASGVSDSTITLPLSYGGAQLEQSSTVGSYIATAGSAAINATLIQNPNDIGKDVLGNSLRLREGGFNLDGSGYAEVADDISLDFGTGGFSIDGWAKFKFTDSGSGSGNVIYTNGGSQSNSNSFAISTDRQVGSSSGVVKFYIGGTLTASHTYVVTDGTWFYFAGTRDNSNNVNLYVNLEDPETGTSSVNVTNSEPKYIGRDSGTLRYYKELVDDIRLYDEELTPDEVLNNYKVGLSKHQN